MCVVSPPPQPADVPKPVSAPGPVLKANSLSNLEQEKSTYRLVTLEIGDEQEGVLVKHM